MTSLVADEQPSCALDRPLVVNRPRTPSWSAVHARDGDGNGFGFEIVSTTSPLPPGYSKLPAAGVATAATVRLDTVADLASPLEPPAIRRSSSSPRRRLLLRAGHRLRRLLPSSCEPMGPGACAVYRHDASQPCLRICPRHQRTSRSQLLSASSRNADPGYVDGSIKRFRLRRTECPQ